MYVEIQTDFCKFTLALCPHSGGAKRRCKLWNYVIPHFESFLSELELSPSHRIDALGKADRVARKLFAAYYPDADFDPGCYAIVGSYGKGTAAKPRTDVDMIFVLPGAEFSRFNSLANQKQSALLQEVKYELLDRFPTTDVRGDGPVVKVPFDSYEFEVCPVFQLQDGSFLNAHTKSGGRWGHTHPAAEINWLNAVDARSLQKASQLVKMLKAWKRECNVEVRSICLETLAILFVDQWQYRNLATLLWHDWMIRDFFNYAHQFSVDGFVRPAGIQEWIPAGDWKSKCFSAYGRAVKACQYEHDDQGNLAVDEWQEIFGYQFRTEYPIASLNPYTASILAGLRS